MQELYIGQKGLKKMERDRDIMVLRAFYDTNIIGKATEVTTAIGYIKIDIGAVLMLEELLKPQNKANKGVTNE